MVHRNATDSHHVPFCVVVMPETDTPEWALSVFDHEAPQTGGVGIDLALCDTIRCAQRRVSEAREHLTKIKTGDMG
ncbi:hypothetical protein [Mesorhizobium sp. ES1-4]|uniref:hypothetical protein n=1 Tax=Mesorhizobium sp. ES1-4 TaxID=2876627 RepID=UPI001CC9E6FF|nr:hypothetical protein [Mesorhizobium sp. ES1-4]MBZ9799432.1 hypothetical protein [Mesorhizobium sp. ES1-4]